MYALIQADLRYFTTKHGEQFVVTALTTKTPLLLVGNLDTSRSTPVYIHIVFSAFTLKYSTA